VKSLPRVDVVIVGGGWTGLLMAKELGARTHLSIVVLERGPQHEPHGYLTDMDELDYAIRLRMMQDVSLETVTFRHHPKQRALPVRQLGSFLPGTGVGGAGEHWQGWCPRFSPDSFEIRTRTLEKYGAQRLPGDCDIRDWGIKYAELEPYYTRAEYLMGVSGKAGNLKGSLAPGGDPFEGPRSAEFPTPPMKMPQLSEMFRSAAPSLGLHPCPIPAATISTPYTNPDGVYRLGCVYCGFCERFGCMIGAKAQPTNTLMPVISKHKNVAIRPHCSVRRILCDVSANRQHAKGVVYVNGSGEEVFQPAELVVLASWTLNNTRLLLLSNIGTPYDPVARKGTLGRHLTHQLTSGGATGFFDKPLNRFMGAGASGIMVSDFDADNFGHEKLNFLRGGKFFVVASGTRPIANFGVVPNSVNARWGSEWKKVAIKFYDQTGAVLFSGEHLSYTSNFMDLDPTYKDHLGDPLLRFTLNWQDNERNMTAFASAKAVEMLRAMGAVDTLASSTLQNYDSTRYQFTHIQGGTSMGRSPEESVLNPWLQHWDVSNLFALGASSFPQNGSGNPTLTILAQTYRTADAIVERYVKKPGPLVD
jgi:gluconate 2-dehydrogenase alpha chain